MYPIELVLLLLVVGVGGADHPNIPKGATVTQILPPAAAAAAVTTTGSAKADLLCRFML